VWAGGRVTGRAGVEDSTRAREEWGSMYLVAKMRPFPVGDFVADL
jgi:hypothetical protein